MKWWHLVLVSMLTLLIGVGCSSQNEEEKPDTEPDDRPWAPEEITEQDRHPLLLVGIDGVKPGYLESDFADTPNLDRLIDNGVWAESLKPVFPSHTFPNLYSIVTGLYPENHGIVGNTVYDPERDETLQMSDNDAQTDPNWWGGEPIWVSAESQGLKAATFFWVGSEAEIGGISPTHYVSYDSRIPHTSRTNQVVRWLTEEEPVDFATLYFASPDGRGHAHGPYSSEVVQAIEDVDAQIGRLIDGLDQEGLWPDINLLVVSDHGMAQLDEDKVVFLDDIIDLNHVDVISWTPVAMIAPKPGHSDAVYQALKSNDDHYSVYRRQELPERFRLRESPRVPDIVVVADEPYTLTSRGFFATRDFFLGGHGFDPESPSMHGILIAHGPDFPEGTTTETLKLVDIYSLMTHLLALEPATHDGSLERIGRQVFGD